MINLLADFIMKSIGLFFLVLLGIIVYLYFSNTYKNDFCADGVMDTSPTSACFGKS